MSFEIIFENLYSQSTISENIRMPSPPNLGGKDSSIISMSEQLMPPDIAGINLVLTISSSCFSWLLMFGIVRIKFVGLCLNPVIKHEYAACDSYYAIIDNIRNSVIHCSVFSFI